MTLFSVHKGVWKSTSTRLVVSEGSGTIVPMSQHETLIGYARVSTHSQDPALQLDALERAGCQRIYSDVGSGTIRRRPELEKCLDYLRVGDTLVVWRLDRLGRSLRHLVELVGELQEHDIAFRSVTEAIDSTTPAGRLQLHLFAALAEFERHAARGMSLVMPRVRLCRIR